MTLCNWQAYRQDREFANGIQRFETPGRRKNKPKTQGRTKPKQIHKTKTDKIEKLQTELNQVRLEDAQKLADMERRITHEVRP